MYGRYTKDLGEYAKDEARKLKILERRRKEEDKARNKVSLWLYLADRWIGMNYYELITDELWSA